MRIVLAAIALLLPAAPHDTSVSSSRFTLEPRGITLTFTLTLEDFLSVVDWSGDADGVLRPERFEALLPDLFQYLSERLTVTADGSTLRPRFVGGLFPGGTPLPLSNARSLLGVVLSYPAERATNAITFRCEAFRDRVVDPKHLAEFPDGQTFVLDKDRGEAAWKDGESRLAHFGHFVVLGMEHILTGWDHLVFLVSLLVATRSFRNVFKFVTAFTVAHSITLGLTALQVLRLSGALVEPLIAASIVCVAAENLLVRDSGRRWIPAFAFGLIHGMGFGGALLEMNLSNPASALLGFNLGVEFGQLGVVGLLFPLLSILRRKELFYRSVILQGGSLGAAALGGFWFFARVF